MGTLLPRNAMGQIRKEILGKMDVPRSQNEILCNRKAMYSSTVISSNDRRRRWRRQWFSWLNHNCGASRMKPWPWRIARLFGKDVQKPTVKSVYGRKPKDKRKIIDRFSNKQNGMFLWWNGRSKIRNKYYEYGHEAIVQSPKSNEPSNEIRWNTLRNGNERITSSNKQHLKCWLALSSFDFML